MQRATTGHYVEKEDRWEVSIKSFPTKCKASLVEGEREIVKTIRDRGSSERTQQGIYALRETEAASIETTCNCTSLYIYITNNVYIHILFIIAIC